MALKRAFACGSYKQFYLCLGAALLGLTASGFAAALGLAALAFFGLLAAFLGAAGFVAFLGLFVAFLRVAGFLAFFGDFLPLLFLPRGYYRVKAVGESVITIANHYHHHQHCFYHPSHLPVHSLPHT